MCSHFITKFSKKRQLISVHCARIAHLTHVLFMRVNTVELLTRLSGAPNVSNADLPAILSQFDDTSSLINCRCDRAVAPPSEPIRHIKRTRGKVQSYLSVIAKLDVATCQRTTTSRL